MDVRRLLLALSTFALVVLAAAPALVVFGLEWLSLGDAPASGDASSAGSSPESWVLFAGFYLAWMFGLMALAIVVNDRLGRRWRSWDRSPRLQKKRLRRREAGLKYLEGQEKARAEAERETARARTPERASARAKAAERPPRVPRGKDAA